MKSEEIKILRALLAYEKPNYTEKEIRDAIEKAIKALEAQRWIPLTKDTIDRLKDHHWYLITHKDYETPIKAKFHLGGLQHFTWYNGGGIWCCSYYIEGYDNEVLAWMPLPDPYKEEDDT